MKLFALLPLFLLEVTALSPPKRATPDPDSSNSDPQKSLTLNPKVIAKGFENNGQGVKGAGQVASLTSPNNFINFCLTVPNLPITNGKQITTGSCNPAPMGIIPSTANIPSAKFRSPANLATIPAHKTFTIELRIRGMATGFFVNAEQNYYSAPQQLNSNGEIIGHSHVVIERIKSFQQTDTTNPVNFIFFKGLNAPAANGILSAEVTGGVGPGTYRIASITTAANHQPILAPVAQHGAIDDIIYIKAE